MSAHMDVTRIVCLNCAMKSYHVARLLARKLRAIRASAQFFLLLDMSQPSQFKSAAADTLEAYLREYVAKHPVGFDQWICRGCSRKFKLGDPCWKKCGKGMEGIAWCEVAPPDPQKPMGP